MRNEETKTDHKGRHLLCLNYFTIFFLKKQKQAKPQKDKQKINIQPFDT